MMVPATRTLVCTNKYIFVLNSISIKKNICLGAWCNYIGQKSVSYSMSQNSMDLLAGFDF